MNWPLFVLVNVLFIPTLGQAILQASCWGDAAAPIGFACILVFLDVRSVDLWIQTRNKNKTEMVSDGSDDAE